MKMVTPEKILQTMNSWQSGEVIAVRRKNVPGPPPALININISAAQHNFINISRDIRTEIWFFMKIVAWYFHWNENY